MTNEEYMQTSVGLAEKGVGFVNPNPLVGAVIVKDGKIIGQGHHAKYGGWHAEINALENCADTPDGATMYVTLEPCCHYGKTPPCTQAIISSGLKKVVIGCLDPNPQVSGKGIMALTDAGIEVESGVLEKICRKQNEVFFHYVRTKTPYVVMKYAMTADGKIAAATGDSGWVSGETARAKVHNDRHRYMGIMIGIGTVLADDPLLTCRIDGGRNPVRIICDTHLRMPLKSRIAESASTVRTIIATASKDECAQNSLAETGCEIIHVPVSGKHIDLRVLMQKLGSIGIDSILLEGGSSINFSALSSNIVRKVQTYIAPKIFGGASAKTPVGGEGFLGTPGYVKLKRQELTYLDEDILIESEVLDFCLQES